MEFSVISDTITTIAFSAQGLSSCCFNFTFNRHYNVFSDQQPPSASSPAAALQIVAAAPSTVKCNSTRTLPRRMVRRTRRTKRKSLTGDDGGDEINGLLFFGDGGDFIGNNGYFGGGFGGWGSGGGGWNSDGYGGANSEESSFHDPAFDFVYEVLSWIALSNCLHFAFKKILRFVGDGFGNPARGKVPLPLPPVCSVVMIDSGSDN